MDKIIWNDKNIKILKELHPITSNKDLAEILGTTVIEISSKAIRLRLLKTKETIARIHSGPKKNGKPERKVRASGLTFLYKPTHPNCDKEGYIGEHRYIMEQILHRFLKTTEIVKHKNNNKSDNRPENLELKEFYRKDVLDSDVFKDRESGMLISEIIEKYNISTTTYYNKIKNAKKIKDSI